MNERACLVDELASESRGLSSALPAWGESQLEVEAVQQWRPEPLHTPACSSHIQSGQRGHVQCAYLLTSHATGFDGRACIPFPHLW